MPGRSQTVAGIDTKIRADADEFVSATRRASEGLRRHRDAVRQTDQGYRRFNRTAASVGRSVRRLAAPLLAFGSVGGAAAGFNRVSRSAGQYAAQIVEAADNTGVAVETLQLLERVAEGDGIAFNNLTQGVARFNYRLAQGAAGQTEFARAFRILGDDIENYIDLAPDEAFIRLADAIQNVEDVGRRTVVLRSLLGITGAQFGAVLQEGGEGPGGLREQLENAQQIAVLSDDQARSLKDLDQTYTDLSNTASAFWRQLAADSVEATAPVLRFFQRLFDLPTRRLRQYQQDLAAAGITEVGQAEPPPPAEPAEDVLAVNEKIAASYLTLQQGVDTFVDGIRRTADAAEAQADAFGQSERDVARLQLRLQLIGQLETKRLQAVNQIAKAEQEGNDVARQVAAERVRQIDALLAGVDATINAASADIERIVAQQLRLKALREDEAQTAEDTAEAVQRISDAYQSSLRVTAAAGDTEDELRSIVENLTFAYREQANELERRVAAFGRTGAEVAAEELRARALLVLDRERAAAVLRLNSALRSRNSEEAAIVRNRIAEIDALSNAIDAAIASAAPDLQRVADATRQLEEIQRIESIADSVGNALGGLAREGIRGFNDLADAARRAGLAIAESIIQQTVVSPVAGFISQGISAFAGNVVGSLLPQANTTASYSRGGGDPFGRVVQNVYVSGSDEAAVRRGITEAGPALARQGVSAAAREAGRPSHFRTALTSG